MPSVNVLRLSGRSVDAHAVEMYRGNRNLPLRQRLGYLGRPFSGYEHFEDVPNHIGCDLIHDPVMFVIRVFDVAIRRIGTQRFAGFTLCLEHRTDFLIRLDLPIDFTAVRDNAFLFQCTGNNTLVNGGLLG